MREKLAVIVVFLICTGFSAIPKSKAQDHPQKKEPIKVLLVGDSTTIGNVPRQMDPDRPHLEQMIELLSKAEGLPDLEVVNAGKGGETAKRLLGSKWYAKSIAPVTDVDFIFLRLGINDWFRCEDLESEFPVQLKAVIGQLRADHPESKIVVSTICCFMPHEECVQVNKLIKQVAQDESLPLFDLYTPYHNYLLKNGNNSLNLRQCLLDKIPEKYHQWLKPYTVFRKGWGNKPDAFVVRVNDQSLDPVLGHIKPWYFDRHPNSTGYNLIAVETVKFLADKIGKSALSSHSIQEPSSQN